MGGPLCLQVEKEPEQELEPIPDVEWWDARILNTGAYAEPAEQPDAGDSTGLDQGLNRDRITAYVEHPVPIEPPAEGEVPPPRPLMLTKKVVFAFRGNLAYQLDTALLTSILLFPKHSNKTKT